ncbi:MAG: hypothetical protein FWD42_11010, partial [Solirubrobacterales bacterium]|nr:hypothetical protein [Solirubrobacterales bacterium]
MSDHESTQPLGPPPGGRGSGAQPSNGRGRAEAVPPPSGAAPVRSGLAQRRNPLLVRARELAGAARRVVLRDKLALFLVVASAALATAFFVLLGSIGPSSHGAELPISEVVSLAERRQVVSAVMLDHDSRVEIRLRRPLAAIRAGRANTTSPDAPLPASARLEYWAAYPVSGAQTQGLLQTLTRAGVVVTVDQQSGKAPRAILVQFLLPILLLVCLFALFMRVGADGGAGGIAAFSEFAGKGRRKGKG